MEPSGGRYGGIDGQARQTMFIDTHRREKCVLGIVGTVGSLTSL